MHSENVRYKMFARRTALIAGGKIVLLSVLAGRMYQLQVLEARRYKLLADENRINLRVLAPPRGQVLDRFGKPLAINRENYRVLLVAEKAEDLNETLDALARIIPVSERDRQRIIKAVGKRRRFVPVTVRENLDWHEFSRIAVNMPDLHGIRIDVGQIREYPFGSNIAHVLGYVAAVAEEELTGDPLLELPGFRIGKSGIEKVYERTLRGRPGNSKLEVNAVGRVIQELERQDGEPGEDLTLSVDMGLQEFVVRRLSSHKSASAVVLDVHGGEVLALASTPSFDPNTFTKGLTPEEWRVLASDHRAPLTNKAVSGLYAPGSTFKVVVALAALEARVGFSWQKISCGGYTVFGRSRFHCWKRSGHGSLNMIQAIQQSCDVYFYEIARRVGINRIATMARRLGLGHTLGIELPNEKAGLIPTKDWKLATVGRKWVNGETLIAGIGQGYVLATPLQLAVMTARVANGGYAVTPKLIRNPVDEAADGEPGPAARPFPSLGLSRDALLVVLSGMKRVTNSRLGTAYAARIQQRGMEMGGKTGTSQVRRISRRERQCGVIKNEK